MNDVDVDVLVVGSGVAGLSTALGLTGVRRVLLLDAGDGSTRWAQGGIAAVVSAADDTADHAHDTAVAGADACDPAALGVLVEEGPLRVAELIGAGARFDRAPDGRLATTLEGGHGRRRVVHAGGDATGAEVHRALSAAAEAAGIPHWHDATVTGLTVSRRGARPQVTGAVVSHRGMDRHVSARAVVLATGGIGHAYPVSTNPAGVTGTGLAVALLAGATLTDLEFVQFHPTVLAGAVDGAQLPLVSEAVRGEGAVLRDADGRAFMAGRHPLADLAPRDVVARAVHEVMTAAGTPNVWLDGRSLGADVWAQRFPTVTAACHAAGIDPVTDLIPVAPAEHFLCGGIATDRWGATDVTGLFAVGEAAATGVHGANRLASNSLLEGMVFGRRVAARLTLELPDVSGEVGRLAAYTSDAAVAAVARQALGRHAGIVRDAAGLAAGAASISPSLDPTALVAAAVITAAATRQESRGCHFRADFPEASDWWRRRVAVRLDDDAVPTATIGDAAGDSRPIGSDGWAA